MQWNYLPGEASSYLPMVYIYAAFHNASMLGIYCEMRIFFIISRKKHKKKIEKRENTFVDNFIPVN